VVRVAAALFLVVALGGCAAAPAIPHSVSQTTYEWCVSCHAAGTDGAPLSPHPDRPNCVGCHKQGGTTDVGALGDESPAAAPFTLP
jgi:hypothetical protein